MLLVTPLSHTNKGLLLVLLFYTPHCLVVPAGIIEAVSGNLESWSHDHVMFLVSWSHGVLIMLCFWYPGVMES